MMFSLPLMIVLALLLGASGGLSIGWALLSTVLLLLFGALYALLYFLHAISIIAECGNPAV